MPGEATLMSGRGQERKGVATLARHRDANQRMTTRGCMPGGSWPPNTPGLPPVAVQGPLLELGGSTFRTCGSLTAQVGPEADVPRLGGISATKATGETLLPSNRPICGSGRGPGQVKRPERQNEGALGEARAGRGLILDGLRAVAPSPSLRRSGCPKPRNINCKLEAVIL